MIYTSYEMVRDCRANLAEGWRYFVRQYVPVIRKVQKHYGHGETPLEPVLAAVHRGGSSLFQVLEPVPERPFVAELRQRVVAEMEPPAARMELGLDRVAAALEPLTLMEKQAAWMETMGYGPGETGEMLRMSAATVEKIRGRAADLVRGQVDAWNSGLLAENGPALGRAAAKSGADCLPAKTFLDVLDGRATWRGRERMEQHVLGCWHCIDHSCRLVEAVELLRGNRPLTEEQAAPFDRLLGIEMEKRGGWRRWFGENRPHQNGRKLKVCIPFRKRCYTLGAEFAALLPGQQPAPGFFRTLYRNTLKRGCIRV